MSGMNRHTGRGMDEDESISESCADILTTPIGSRVLRREYGSMVPFLIDHPTNPANKLRLMSATVMALIRWEPRIAVSRIGFSIDMGGKSVVEMDATRRTGPRSGQPINLSIPVR